MIKPLRDGDQALLALPAADLDVTELVEFAGRNADWYGERFILPPTAEAWAFVLNDVSQLWYGIVAGESATVGAVLGIVVFTRWSGPPWRSAEIGFGVDRTISGRGAIQASVPAVLRRHLGVDLQRVEARVHPDNGAAARSLARLGFCLEGRLRGSIDADGGRADQDQWAVVVGDELTPTTTIADQAHDESSR